MLESELVVVNSLGLHARAAAKLVRLATGFSSTITLIREDNGIQADAKSILSLLYIAAGKGVRLKLMVDGEDELAAIRQITTLFDDRFGEES